jgi:hypothetical protein
MSLLLQNLIVAALVAGCVAYAVWTLMPNVARRTLAVALLRWPHWPARLAARLQRSAGASSGCGCDGCDRATPARKQAASPVAGAQKAEQRIVFHPRAER